MAKGYWIGTSDVIDMDGMQRYRAANWAAMQRHGARMLVAGGQQEVREGQARGRQVVVEFPSYVAAIAAYQDPEYQTAAKIRQSSAHGDLVIVEGFDPPAG